MKTETIQTTANRVQAGDRILGELVTGVSQESPCVTMIQLSGLKNPARVPSEWPITITRPVTDPCPRGMISPIVIGNGVFIVGKSITNDYDIYVIWKRIRALWNEAEQQTPYRTTAEIEAGLEARE